MWLLIKILEIVYDDPEAGGGLETFALNLSHFLSRKGFSITFLYNKSYNKNKRLKSLPHKINKIGLGSKVFQGFPSFLNKIIYNLWIYFYVLKNRNNFDLYHINGDNGAFITTIKGIKTIMTWHGSSLLAFKKRELSLIGKISLTIKGWLEIFGSRRSSVVTSVSPSLLKYIKKVSKRNDIIVIENFVDTDRYIPANKTLKRSKLGLDQNKIYAIWVGVDAKRKRLDFVISLIKAHEDIHLIAIGGTSHYYNSSNIKLLGYIQEDLLIEYYQASDIFIFPSVYEGFSIAVIEAMACGVVPVLSKAVAESIPGLIDGANCFVADNDNDYEKILTNIERNPTLLKSMSIEARKLAENYSLDIKGVKYEEIILKLMYHTNCA